MLSFHFRGGGGGEGGLCGLKFGQIWSFSLGCGGGGFWSAIPERLSGEFGHKFTVRTESCLCITYSLSHTTYVETNDNLSTWYMSPVSWMWGKVYHLKICLILVIIHIYVLLQIMHNNFRILAYALFIIFTCGRRLDTSQSPVSIMTALPRFSTIIVVVTVFRQNISIKWTHCRKSGTISFSEDVWCCLKVRIFIVM